MYGWTENVEFWGIFLGIIWDLWDVFTVHICSARAQIQFLRDELSSNIRNLIRLLVSVMSHCLQTFAEDFLGILLEMTTF